MSRCLYIFLSEALHSGGRLQTESRRSGIVSSVRRSWPLTGMITVTAVFLAFFADPRPSRNAEGRRDCLTDSGNLQTWRTSEAF
ncbi:hypothetical protein QQF64_003138 [Cirrhinus molitorella]|uniref:Uncharacterized protein n=1 Tax=Cirrhinus molitorella TaxID=172907 RepID=A0ABR3MKG3_9TELE